MALFMDVHNIEGGVSVGLAVGAMVIQASVVRKFGSMSAAP